MNRSAGASPRPAAFACCLLPAACCLLSVACCLLVGCGPPSGFHEYRGGHLGASISAKRTWSAEGSLATPPAAIDGDDHTAARSDYSYAGAELTIDLHQSCLFQTVVIEHGRDERGFCRTVGVATSIDGRVFVDRYSAPGNRRVTIISLPAPVLARYVRLTAVTPGTEPWSVAEVYLQ